MIVLLYPIFSSCAPNNPFWCKSFSIISTIKEKTYGL